MTHASLVLCPHTHTHTHTHAQFRQPKNLWQKNTENDSVIHYICNLSFIQKEKQVSSLFSTKQQRKKKKDKKACILYKSRTRNPKKLAFNNNKKD